MNEDNENQEKEQTITASISKAYPNIEYVEAIEGGKHLLKDSTRAYILRPRSELFPAELDLRRRIEAVERSRSLIHELRLSPHYELIETGGDTYILKSLPWIENLMPISQLPISKLASDRHFWGRMSKAYFFLLKELVRGRAYDLLEASSGESLIHKYFLSDNIFFFYSQDGSRELFLDLDWFIQVSDSDITGFSVSSYYKRMVQGAYKFTVGIIVFNIMRLLSRFR
jgi:hypothetical protein